MGGISDKNGQVKEMNNAAFIDLSKQEAVVKNIPERLRRRYLGGRGLNMYLLYNYAKPDIDPLSP